MKLHWLILVVGLAVQAFAATTDTPDDTDGDVTTTGLPSGEVTTDGPAGSSSTLGGDSTDGPGGSSSAPGENPTDGPAGPSSAPGEETSPAQPTSSTGKPTTTTTQPKGSTLPNVDVPHVQFKIDTCANGVCTYTYLAPQNDQTVLQQDQDIITYDRNEYNEAKTNVSNFNASIASVTDPATTKVNDLKAQLENAKSQLAAMQQQLKYILANTQNSSKSLDKAEYFINNFLDNSCFNKCALPPTSPPTTTPTTPVPTTTESPCVTFCEKTEPATTCSIEADRPFCTGCTGNLDGYSACTESACASVISPPLPADTGVFLTPNYTIVIENGGSCFWQYPNASAYDGYKLNVTDGSNKVNFPPSVTVQLTPDNNDFDSFPITSGTTVSSFNKSFKKCAQGFVLELDVGPDAPEDFRFEWIISYVTPPSTESP